MRTSEVTLEVFVAALSDRAFLPQKAHAADAGFDLAIPEDTRLPPQAHQQLDLEIALQIPPGWYGQVFGRSSVFRRGLSVHPGVIDADYRGALQLLIYNHLPVEQQVRRGDRLAQLLLLPVPHVQMIRVTPAELTPTLRGANGLGSTGR